MNLPRQHPTREFLLQHTGQLSQLGGITAFTHAEGRGKGVATLRVRTARGLEFWVVPDRGMDIYEASWLGSSLCWHSPTGMVHPAYYSRRGTEWLRSFAGGLLCTCGLTTAGAPSEDSGEALGLHGSISNTPAEGVRWSEEWEGEDCRFTISGRVRETSVFGPNLLLERTISTSLLSDALSIRDRVVNQGFNDSPLMVLYHFNFGFSLLTEKSRIYAPSQSIEPSSQEAAGALPRSSYFEAPELNASEKVFYHRMQPDADGWATVVLVSDDERQDFGIALRYDSSTLPEFAQWRMPGAGHYVLGLEPANCRTLGRAAERRRGTLQTLPAGSTREFHLQLQVLEGAEAVAAAVRQAIRTAAAP